MKIFTTVAGGTAQRKGAVIAAVALVAMAVIAPLAAFGILGSITAANIAANSDLLRLAATGLTVVVVLDIVVAWGLFVVFRQNRSLSLLAAWLRLLYSAIFAGAVADIFRAVLAVGTAGDSVDQAMLFLDSFHLIWQAGLFVFGFHLIAIAALLWRPGVVERVLGVLVAVAGAGYLTDGLGTMLSSSYSLGIAQFTFIGEVLLIIWLFWRGGKVVPKS